jgi:CRISPR-associated protein Csb1
MTEPITLTHDIINGWADNPDGPVALYMKQKLIPVEGEGGVIFPPTYADIGYNIDELSDGTKVATIDSVGSQANRMEPIFKRPDLAHLVPQITIQLGNDKSVSLLDVGHRLGDALVRSAESTLSKKAVEAFAAYDRGDPTAIAKLAPTSLVFGAWDSRGKGVKIPRLITAVIRAWNVEVLHRAATYLPAIDFASDDLLGPHNENEAEKDARSALGFQHAPATWSPNDKIPQYREGRPNIERRMLGGVIAKGEIIREVIVNLVALRKLGDVGHQQLRHYILGLTLVAASDPQDGFLRQGCLLICAPDSQSVWQEVHRTGERKPVKFSQGDPVQYAKSAADKFVVGPAGIFHFNRNAARKLIDEQKGGKKGKRKTASEAVETPSA